MKKVFVHIDGTSFAYVVLDYDNAFSSSGYEQIAYVPFDRLIDFSKLLEGACLIVFDDNMADSQHGKIFTLLTEMLATSGITLDCINRYSIPKAWMFKEPILQIVRPITDVLFNTAGAEIVSSNDSRYLVSALIAVFTLHKSIHKALNNYVIGSGPD